MRYRFKHEMWLMSIGGVLYGLIELIFRGRTHWSMVLLGGMCFRTIGYIHDRFRHRFSVIMRCALCATIISVAELSVGLVVNKWLDLHVWDYSRQPLNIAGQICPLFSAIWGALSLLVIPLFRCCMAQIAPFYSNLGQNEAIGHRSHFGERAVHVSLPNNTNR